MTFDFSVEQTFSLILLSNRHSIHNLDCCRISPLAAACLHQAMEGISESDVMIAAEGSSSTPELDLFADFADPMPFDTSYIESEDGVKLAWFSWKAAHERYTCGPLRTVFL